MKHLGDITKIDWSQVEPVDVVTGGSPCQDLSVAGKRAGLAGERSGLYMEQIRCVKELRQADVLRGRTGRFIRPRFMVWENVPGAFSSGTPKGSDFAAVIEELIKIAEPDASVCIVPPSNGWTKSGCYYADDGRWSIAWRVHDAQFWGVPQRRKRIALVADFGGLAAPEVLFERKGLSRDSEPCGTEREATSRSVGEGVESASGLYEPMSLREENWAKREVKNALRSGESKSAHAVVAESAFVGVDAYNHEITGEVAATLNATSCATATRSGPSVMSCSSTWLCFEPRIHGAVCPTLNTAQGGQRQPCVVKE